MYKKGGGGSFGSSDPPPSFLCRISSSDACVPLALNHFFHRFNRRAVNIVQEILECRNRLAAVQLDPFSSTVGMEDIVSAVYIPENNIR